MSVVTLDNVRMDIDAIQLYRVVDPKLASYAVEDHEFAIKALAMSTVRVEMGKLPLDKTFEERESINTNIVREVNAAVQGWGLECLRFEIRDIKPPAQAMAAMELQMIAERRKRQQIIESEGTRASEINVAEGMNRATVLRAEAQRAEVKLLAEGEADAIRARAHATADGVRLLADAIASHKGADAVSLRLAEQYIASLSNIAKETNTVVLPASMNDVSGMVSKATSIFSALRRAENNAEKSQATALDHEPISPELDDTMEAGHVLSEQDHEPIRP